MAAIGRLWFDNEIRKGVDMVKMELTEKNLVKVWKKLERESGKWVGANAVCQEMGVVQNRVRDFLQEKGFDGFNEFKSHHGIKQCPQESKSEYTSNKLLEKYDRVVTKYKKIPTFMKIKSMIRIPDSTFKKKFGNKEGIVTAYEKWLKKNKPNSRNLKIVETFLKAEDKPAKLTTAAKKQSDISPSVYQKIRGKRTYGKPLGFRHMIYEPTCEQGVVFLFGMISEELGFSIEGVWQEFHDCEAKRIINRTTGEQQQVRIEFEAKSRDFIAHGHDPKKCDLIICWKNNWKDCPIDVLDLSKAIKELPTRP
ncbi:MAG: hypothetical protein ACYSUB_08000 [Planctomycetota bacterium]